METTTSGWIRQPSFHSRAGTLSAALPSIAPLSAQTLSTLISEEVNLGALRSALEWESANHGGICLVTTADLIAFAQGRVFSYVRKDIGAMPLGRWHS